MRSIDKVVTEIFPSSSIWNSQWIVSSQRVMSYNAPEDFCRNVVTTHPDVVSTRSKPIMETTCVAKILTEAKFKYS